MAPRQDSMDSESFETITVGPNLNQARKKLFLGKVVVFFCFAFIIALFFLAFTYPPDHSETSRENMAPLVSALVVCAIAALGLYLSYRRETRTIEDDTERVVLGQESLVLEKHHSTRRIPYDRIVHVAVRYALKESSRDIYVSHRRVELQMFRDDGSIIDTVRGSFPAVNKVADKIRQQVWWASGMEDTVGDQQSDREIRIKQKKPLLKIGRLLGLVLFAVCLAILGFNFYMDTDRRSVHDTGIETPGVITRVSPAVGNYMINYLYIDSANKTHNGRAWLPEEKRDMLHPGSPVSVRYSAEKPHISTAADGVAPISPWLVALFLLPMAILALLCALKYDIAWVGRRLVVLREDQLAEDFLQS